MTIEAAVTESVESASAMYRMSRPAPSIEAATADCGEGGRSPLESSNHKSSCRRAAHFRHWVGISAFIELPDGVRPSSSTPRATVPALSPDFRLERKSLHIGSPSPLVPNPDLTTTRIPISPNPLPDEFWFAQCPRVTGCEQARKHVFLRHCITYAAVVGGVAGVRVEQDSEAPLPSPFNMAGRGVKAERGAGDGESLVNSCVTSRESTGINQDPELSGVHGTQGDPAAAFFAYWACETRAAQTTRCPREAQR